MSGGITLSRCLGLLKPNPGHVSFRYLLAAIITISMVVALSGITLRPLESHEAFVLGTAQSMYDNQNWIVPWFNGEPRLTKPPLGYWLTALTAYVAGGIAQIQPWHGRLPSAIAAIGIVVLTVLSGRKLFGTRHGLLAGLMLATSSGFYYYAHSARPEMVYAFFCTAALTSYLYVVSSSSGSQSRIASKLIWVCFALATLTKGPQIPLIFLSAFLVDMRYRKLGLKEILDRFQPVRGLVIFLLITLPWWWLVDRQAGGIQGTQLSGSLLKLDIFNVADPYYFYRPLQLMLPWVFLLPTIFFVPWKKIQPSYFVLAVAIAAAAVFLSFGPQKRWYYMLPLLAPMFLILAIGTLEVVQRAQLKNSFSRYLSWLFVVIPLIFIVAIHTPWVVNEEKAAEENLALSAQSQVRKGQTLILWNVGSSEVFVYHARTKVVFINDADQLAPLLANPGGRRFSLVMQAKRLDELPPGIHFRIIGRTGVTNRKGLVLVELT